MPLRRPSGYSHTLSLKAQPGLRLLGGRHAAVADDVHRDTSSNPCRVARSRADPFGSSERWGIGWPARSSTIIESVLMGSTSITIFAVSYTHLRAHETRHDLVCR